MRSIILVALALGFVGVDTLVAQQEQAALRKKLESKLSEKWVSLQNWTTDYNLARKRAAQSGKLIFAYFTRSYAP